MDLNEAHAFLFSLDSQYEWGNEFPHNFAYDDEVKQVRHVNKVLENELHIPLKVLTCSAQDSYFFAEIVYATEERFRSELSFDLRFSSFGRLVSGWACPRLPALIPDAMEVVRQVVEKAGYRFIDFEWLLHTEYDGPNLLRTRKHSSWWNRFFDYS